MLQDPGYEFEKVIIKFFGDPKTPIYFAAYFDRINKFECRALLFAICVKEANIYSNEYNADDLKKFRTFERELSNDDVEYKKLLECIKFLLEVNKVS